MRVQIVGRHRIQTQDEHQDLIGMAPHETFADRLQRKADQQLLPMLGRHRRRQRAGNLPRRIGLPGLHDDKELRQFAFDFGAEHDLLDVVPGQAGPLRNLAR